jgi:hypothetical protein
VIRIRVSVVLALCCCSGRSDPPSRGSGAVVIPAPVAPPVDAASPPRRELPPIVAPDVQPAPLDVAKPPADAKKTALGVFYKVLKPVKGAAHPTATDRVRIHYTGWTTDGKMFESSRVRGKPIEFPLSGVIRGWSDGIPHIGVGEQARLWIPEELAYKGTSGPAGMLVYDIELLAITSDK